jgi:hypothetical protein
MARGARHLNKKECVFFVRQRHKKNPAHKARGNRRRPIFPEGCPSSIVGAGGLNDRVRDGNGCDPSAEVTGFPAPTRGMVAGAGFEPTTSGL